MPSFQGAFRTSLSAHLCRLIGIELWLACQVLASSLRVPELHSHSASSGIRILRCCPMQRLAVLTTMPISCGLPDIVRRLMSTVLCRCIHQHRHRCHHPRIRSLLALGTVKVLEVSATRTDHCAAISSGHCVLHVRSFLRVLSACECDDFWPVGAQVAQSHENASVEGLSVRLKSDVRLLQRTFSISTSDRLSPLDSLLDHCFSP